MAARHGLKYAVLGLVIEQDAYAYRLVQRFEELVGDAYRLHPSAVYTALNQLEDDGCVVVDERRSVGASRRSPRVVYTATDEGSRVFEEWLTTQVERHLEPVRSELVAKLALAQPSHAADLLEMIDSAELECLDLITAATRRAEQSAAGRRWDNAVSALVHEYGIRQLHARLEWLRDARSTVERLRDGVAVAEE
ncbi:MAG TPA: PadR family transcriptional regulator [Conexibacter sp.]|jgi:DNA-binding PadR family transcriptional regulator